MGNCMSEASDVRKDFFIPTCWSEWAIAHKIVAHIKSCTPLAIKIANR